LVENRHKNRWDVAEKVLCKAITTGNIVPFGILAIGAIIAWRLNPLDLKEVILAVVNSAWFCVLGWLFFLISIYACKKLLTWRDSIHQKEMTRMAEVKNQAVQAHFELPLSTSAKKE
jgi:hypothetical protein